LDGLVLDRVGFFTAREREIVEGSPFVGTTCRSCHETLKKSKLPKYALANRLWMGAGQVPELDGLTWIELLKRN
jgi:hypothetical protein